MKKSIEKSEQKTESDQWKGFVPGEWQDEINVRDFIQKNYTPYLGDSSFLEGPTKSTTKLWKNICDLTKEERKKGILDADTDLISSIISHKPGYINKDLEKIVGVQTDKPLKRAIMPFGGIRMVAQGLEAYGYKISPIITEIFSRYRKTHNEAVHDAYTNDMKRAKKKRNHHRAPRCVRQGPHHRGLSPRCTLRNRFFNSG